MYAILETGGKQYRVSAGDIVFIEKLDVTVDDTVTFDKVVAVSDDENLTVGAPYVEGATVSARVLKNGKAKKITVFTYKPKKNSKRKLGHRQPYTQVRIDEINVGGKPKAAKATATKAKTTKKAAEEAKASEEA